MEPEIKISASPSTDGTRCTFTIDRPVLPGRSYYFGSKLRAEGSPLAEKILEIPGVEAVLLSHDVVTVYAGEWEDWRTIGKQVGASIRAILLTETPPVAAEVFENVPSPEELRKVTEQVLETQINPGVASHGGQVRLIDVKENVLFIEMGGGCQGCGMASVTLRSGVERVLREFLPEVGDILDVTDHAAGRNPYFQGAH